MGVIESLNGSSLQGRNLQVCWLHACLFRLSPEARLSRILQVSFKTERRRSGSNASMTPPHYMTAVTSQPMSPYAMAPHPYSPYGGGSPPTHGIYGTCASRTLGAQLFPAAACIKALSYQGLSFYDIT
jgi:hypothetical protein